MTKSHALADEGRPTGHADRVFPASSSRLCGPWPETVPIRLSPATVKDAVYQIAGNSATHSETMYARFELAIYCRVIENESEDAHT